MGNQLQQNAFFEPILPHITFLQGNYIEISIPSSLLVDVCMIRAYFIDAEIVSSRTGDVVISRIKGTLNDGSLAEYLNQMREEMLYYSDDPLPVNGVLRWKVTNNE